MAVSNALQVVQVRVTPLDAEKARVEIVADYDDAKKRASEPRYNGLEELYAWNSTMGHEAGIEKWPLMPHTRTRTLKSDGRTLDRHILTTEVPLKDAQDLEVAVVAKTNQGPIDVAQAHGKNFKAGYRLDATREYNGRFSQVDDTKLVRDVASFKSRGAKFLAKFGDHTVGELRAMFGGLSVTQIRNMTVAARGALLGANRTTTENAAAEGAMLGVANG